MIACPRQQRAAPRRKQGGYLGFYSAGAMGSGGGGGGDPYFANVVSLNHFDGPGSTTFTDQIGARTWSRTGSALEVSNVESKFGGYSLRTGAISGNYLASDTTADFAFGTADFTIEFWHRTPSLFPPFYFIADWRSAGNEAKPCLFLNSPYLVYYVNGAAQITSISVLAIDTWYHIAISRVSGTTRMFVNGVNVGSFSDATSYVSSRCLMNSAGDVPGTFGTDGYIDDFRVTKGVGRYSANFTPPAGPFPDF